MKLRGKIMGMVKIIQDLWFSILADEWYEEAKCQGVDA